MISFWRQLKFLLWKGVLIKKRQKFWLFIEILVPILLFAILAAVRTRNYTDTEEQCHYDSKGFPSAGLLPFLHSFLCSFSNPCHASPSTGDEGFYINNGTAPHESIAVDFLYYSSLQLDRIGTNPAEFNEIIKEITRIVKILSQLDVAKMKPIRLKDWFTPSFDVTGMLESVGLTAPMADALADSVLSPVFYMEAANWGRSTAASVSIFSLIDFTTVPFLCNQDKFSASFILPENSNLTAADFASLCTVTVSSLSAVNLQKLYEAIKPPFDTLPLRNGTSVDVVVLTSSIEGVAQHIRGQPLGRLFNKWGSRLMGGNNETGRIVDALFCGANPFETSLDGLDPQKNSVETPFDKMKKALIKYIENVVPGQDKRHDKQFCGEVPVHDDLNCSLLESAVIHRLRPIISGYILVTPPVPIVEQLIDKLNGPMRQVDFVRRMMYEWTDLADSFQNTLNQSEVYAASQNLLDYLRNIHPKVPYPSPYIDQFEFVLEHAFNLPSDPYSFGAFTKNITELINQYSTCFLTDRFVMVKDEATMEETAMCLMNYDQYFTGISFLNTTDNGTSFGPFATYKIRHLASMIDTTNGIADSLKRPFSRDKPFSDLKYITYGFSYLQEAIDRAITAISTNTSFGLGIFAQQEPYPCASKDNFNISNFLGLFVILSFIIPASLLVKNIVYEKEQKLKEQMRIMGLGDAVHFLSWALISLVLNMFSTVVISIILKFARIFNHTDFWLLLLFLSLFALSSIALSLLLSTFFTNANISTAATCIIYFLFFFPFQLSVKSKNKTFSRFTLVLPQTTLGYGTMMLAQANEIEQADWAHIHEIAAETYGISLIQCMIAFGCQTVGCLVLAWYISAIAPGVYGVSQPWFFPFTRKYWFPYSRTNDVDDLHDPFDTITSNDSFEAEPSEQKMAVHIKGMGKVYDSGTKALNSLNLRLYENQITALLGHNGAGKTTTMSMLCGLYSPSSGTAAVYGRDIRHDMRRVRDILGVCPQYNVLFAYLTVAEQLEFFAALKGTPDEKLKEEVREILTSVCLTDKADCLASTLSGGMKRRLCIGIALIGGSKFVILDEPTAGVDVNSRKDIWRLLQSNKEGRTILLSTHHMDEADVLSDRVAVLSEGSLVALGSPVFLKNKYGDSFQLVVCKMDRTMEYTEIIDMVIRDAGIPLIKLDETDDELVFRIPLATSSTELEQFFTKFDNRLKDYVFSDYGISAPTLQQIFVRLTPQREYNVPKVKTGLWTKLKKLCCRSDVVDAEEIVLIRDPLGGRTDIATTTVPTPVEEEAAAEGEFDMEPPQSVTGFKRVRGHVRALLACRWHYTLRSKKTTLFEVILPVLLLLACEIYALISTGGTTSYMVAQNPLPLVPQLFGNNTDSYMNVLDRNTTSYSRRIMQSLIEDPGLGTRCSKNAPLIDPLLSHFYTRSDKQWIPENRHITSSSSYPCDVGSARGGFNWSRTDSEVSYNADVECQCTDNLGWNCTLEDYPDLWSLDRIQLNTTDRLWDLSYRNLSQFRMAGHLTTNLSDDSPYFMGGLSLGHQSLRYRSSEEVKKEQQGWRAMVAGLSSMAAQLGLNMSSVQPSAPLVADPFIQNMTVDSFMDTLLANMDRKENVKVWFNNKLWPSLPIYANTLTNALFRVQDQPIDPALLGVLTINHPMNQTVQGAFDQSALQKILIFRITIIVLVLCIIPAGFTVFLVEDRMSDSFHLQLVSGLNKKTYWLTGYLFDMSIYIVACICILLIYVIFGVKEFCYDWTTISSFFLLFWLYGMCAMLWAYFLQRHFAVPALSFVLIAVGTFFIGIVATLTVVIMEQMMQADPTLETPHNVCSWLFLVLPQYNLGMAIFRGSAVYQLVMLGETYLKELNRPDLIGSLPLPNIMDWDLMGLHCLALLIHTFIAAALLAMAEHGSLGFLRRKERAFTAALLENDLKGEDEDVLEEQNRVAEIKNAAVNDAPLIVSKLAKAYSPSHLAVRGVSFAVDKGECFGLLGLNGAGKTTTFGMLTRKTHAGAGSVLVNGFDVTAGESMGFSQLGYCPQFDALNTKLTARENLVFFARIRAIPEQHIDELATRLLRSLHLRPYSDTVTASLSGGNKRKLSVAIALISQPSLILLDEPSAGMDPGSQQFLWKVIERLRRSGKAVVMTSHSMEECEALCTRIAIMDKGKIRCLGSKQHLKNKFGEGYSLTLKMCSVGDAAIASKKMASLMPLARLESIHCSTLFFHMDREASSIAKILEVVNKLKSRLPIEDFSLSQATLAEVFQSLATRQWSLSANSTLTTTLSTTD